MNTLTLSKFCRFVALTLLSFFLISCSAQFYEGPKRAASEVATIKFGDVRPHTVDGRTTRFTPTVQVLPGKRTIGFKSFRDFGIYMVEYAPAHMTFVAKAGHVYRPKLKRGSDNPPKTEIFDETSQRVVAKGVVGQ